MQISQTTPPPTNLNLNSTSANLNPNFDPSNPNPNLHPRRSRKQDNLKIARAVIYRHDSLLRRIQLDNELVDWTNAAGPTTSQGIHAEGVLALRGLCYPFYKSMFQKSGG